MNRPYHHIKKLTLLLCLTVVCSFKTKAQDLSTIKQGFDRYTQTIPHEKVFVHTDRRFYLAGEVIWFKTYTVDANTNAPADMSKVAYVEVLNDKNVPILQGKIELKYGTGNGSFYIPVTAGNGNYRLRAYTLWMKNFSPDLFFEKQLTIVNSLEIPEAPLKQPVLSYDIRFFPEGGQLVNGVNSTVGFKAVGSDGKGADVSGVILGQANDTVARFKSGKFGMGHFSFTPAADRSYKAIVKVANTTVTKDLSSVAANGYVMQVTDGKEQVQIKISSDAAADAEKPVYVLAHQGAAISLAQNIKLNADHSFTLQLDKSKLGDGVNHITLFNADQRPVAERLVFKRPSSLSVKASVQTQYGLRKRVNLDVSATTANDQPQVANMSLAVYRSDSFNGIPDADISSYLGLTSELKGHIESPGYYFANTDTATDAALDDLLLTQGWSRFTWNEALSNLKPTFRYLPEYNGHLITGNVTNSKGLPGRFALVYLAAVSKKVQLYGANAGTTGTLLFNAGNLYGPADLVLQTNPKLDTNTYKININNPFSEEYGADKLPPFYINKTSTALIESNSIGMQALNLYRPERLNTFSAVDSTTFYREKFSTFKLDNFVRFITLEEVLREFTTNANVAKRSGHFHVKVMDPQGYYIDEGKEDPLVLLDGVPVFDLDKAFKVDPLKLQKVDLINQKYFWGPIKTNGILSLTSYKGDHGAIPMDPKALVLDYEGLQQTREFYSPVYDTPEQQKSRLPDQRNLLYWSPNLNTGADGKAQVSFFTSDKAGKYIGVVQGLTAKGLAGSGVFTFDVVK
ncbi:hypothetical protein [Mucilaginibacter myungsuensis]|uniref:MG2 domain-containing protein n=1 Tax=Mucilaginibacter myungsuensis TaxID=649104 RepID=A0A929L0W9_9SPHI|nr:hypothetical protein [Mucilaginibacter myungsuensis]MBE9664093.1 hypothetical protein [Mucilaginibacter myungsuensis]MDN3601272.1 hypothetical protein [Mucilaginibacter myungsuensis]